LDYGQVHVLRWWSELSSAERDSLAGQLLAADFEHIERLTRAPRTQDHNPSSRAERAQPPKDLVRLPVSPDERQEWATAKAAGDALLREGRVGAILVAGGQGSRLGFDHPKGMFPVGPVSGASLFQILCEQVLARSRRAGAPIPYYVMTSDATHDETIGFLREQESFGLDPADVLFFRQGNMPAVDERGRLLLASKGSLSQSPDGHGGLFSALGKSGLLDHMRDRGVDYLYYHQVDNPTAAVCDPAFLGWHIARNCEVSIKVAAKRSADERMGVIVDVDGRVTLIEYSDLPAHLAARTGRDGRLLLWAGNTAIHVFSRAFLERLVDDELALPYHIARKSVPFVDESGNRVLPAGPNALKFERFILDALPLAANVLLVEADRRREFNPVKNASGDDSPQTARAALLALSAERLRSAGATIAEGARVEISPLFALDAEELAQKIPAGTSFSADTYLR
jgi:UDP-N-acetylglucosamine/UDP-N-acetylgalactosamine diphosphorylase